MGECVLVAGNFEGECMKKLFLGAAALLLAVVCTHAWAQDGYREQMKGLDEQVQEDKSDVLTISAELSQLEVTVIGKRANGEDYSRTETVAFTKEIKPKLVGLTVSSDSISSAGW